MALRRTLAAALAVTLAPAAAHARAERDEQIWTSVNASTGLSERVDAMLEVHARYTDDAARLGQLLIRPSVTLKLPRDFSASIGYVYFRNSPEGGAVTEEHRSWEQVAYLFHKDEAGLRVSGRTRIEQRFRVGASDDVGWRLRQQVRFQAPFRPGRPLAAVVWNETFVGFNDTRWGARAGLDQVRTFIGVSLPVAKGVSVEPGYFNQTVFRTGRDRVNHALAAHLFIRLP